MIKNDYAVVSIDMHRGHLDPKVATLPLLPEERCTRVINNTSKLFKELRKKNIPIIHIVTKYRDKDEILSNPHWNEKNSGENSARTGIEKHNIIGEPTTEIIKDLYDETDYIVDTKKRYSSFMYTELEFLLNQIGAKNLIITGINTSSCVLCTSFEATNKDYKTFIIEDCVDSMDGEEFHDAAIMILKRIIGTVIKSEDLIKKL